MGAGGQAPILSVFGGKITTYRHLAESAVGKLSAYLPILAGISRTADAALPGGDFPQDGAPALANALAGEYPFLEAKIIDRIVRNYGTRARQWLGNAANIADLGAHFGHGLYQSEVDYLVACEWACCAEDILWRRNKLGLRFSDAERAVLENYISALVV